MPQLVAANVAKARIETRAVTAEMPAGSEPDMSPLAMARAFDDPERRAALVAALRQAVGSAAGARVGLPAVLGANEHAGGVCRRLGGAGGGGVRGADARRRRCRASASTAR